MSLSSPTLVLNKNWVPLRLTNVADAISKVYAGSAMAVNPDYSTHGFDSWVQEGQSESSIRTATMIIPVPEIIVLVKYKGVPSSKLPLTRENILRRDNYLCQYCSVRPGKDNLTLDHVMPKSRGGGNIWDNMVASCHKCNHDKASKTLKEAGMVLITKPRRPTWIHQLSVQIAGKNKESWSQFVAQYT